MAKQTNTETRGTFAQLYDVHEELSRRTTKPLGRPPKKIRRKPTTIHLTQTESRNLSKLQLRVNDQFSINRSELVGVAIDVLSVLMEEGEDRIFREIGARDLETFRQAIYDFTKS